MFLHLVTMLLLSLVTAAAPTSPALLGSMFKLSESVSAIGVVTNVTNQGGVRPARRNILDLQSDAPSWSLYVQALAKLQEVPEDNLFSYFQIAGIHGRPYTSWNDAVSPPGAPNSTGYCTHGSVLFLPWHRPYLSLFETFLWSLAQDIAGSYPLADRATYQIAANNLRIPYWDWAAIPTLPDIVNAATLQIYTPTGMQEINNPLFTYKFQKFPMNTTQFPSSSEVAGDYWLANWSQTLRGTNSQDAAAVSNASLSNNNLMNQKLKSGVYAAMTKAESFNSFGTTASPGSSLENVHNSVHTAIGSSYGTMTWLSYSAFDPIFWLHHANVDRLFAMWQAMNPDSFVTPQLDTNGAYGITSGQNDSDATPLIPFTVTGDGAFYTAASSRYTDDFGYTYPEIDDWSQNREQLNRSVRAAVNRLYAPQSMFGLVNQIPSQLSSRNLPATSIPIQQTTHWSIDIQVNKFDLKGVPFTVYVFLGNAPSDTLSWSTSKNLVGSFSVFAPPTPMDAAGTHPVVTTYTEMSLIEPLEHTGHDLEDKHVISKHLSGNLKWAVLNYEGSLVPLRKVPSLVVKVQDEAVTLPRDIAEFPIYGAKTIHSKITKGKLGGYGHR